jgi:hypothetical protein
MAVEKEIQNVTQVNRYIEDKIEGELTQGARIEDEIGMLKRLLEGKME